MAGLIFALLFWMAVITTIAYFIVSYRKAHEGKRKEELETQEKKRVRECGEVITFFANTRETYCRGIREYNFHHSNELLLRLRPRSENRLPNALT